jgi:hypothetical protein
MILKKENIPKSMAKLELRKLFIPFGHIKAIRRRSTFAFVQMSCKYKAKMTVLKLDAKTWKEELINGMLSKTDFTATICKLHSE